MDAAPPTAEFSLRDYGTLPDAAFVRPAAAARADGDTPEPAASPAAGTDGERSDAGGAADVPSSFLPPPPGPPPAAALDPLLASGPGGGGSLEFSSDDEGDEPAFSGGDGGADGDGDSVGLLEALAEGGGMDDEDAPVVGWEDDPLEADSAAAMGAGAAGDAVWEGDAAATGAAAKAGRKTKDAAAAAAAADGPAFPVPRVKKLLLLGANAGRAEGSGGNTDGARSIAEDAGRFAALAVEAIVADLLAAAGRVAARSGAPAVTLGHMGDVAMTVDRFAFLQAELPTAPPAAALVAPQAAAAPGQV